MRDEANALSVALGGGRRNFIPTTVTDGENKRADVTMELIWLNAGQSSSPTQLMYGIK